MEDVSSEFLTSCQQAAGWSVDEVDDGLDLRFHNCPADSYICSFLTDRAVLRKNIQDALKNYWLY